MRILVCGGRQYGDLLSLNHDKTHPLWEQRHREYIHIMTTLEQFAIENSKCFNPNDNWLPEDFVIISGKAKGVDSVAIDWAVTNWCPFVEYPADWAKFGRAAGHKRNRQMLEEGKPDIVIAFPGGRGTKNMTEIAKKAGIKVIEVANADSL